MTKQQIEAAWNRHCQEDWPVFSSSHQGQLMTLDTVISGCVIYYLDSPDGLDDQRLAILKDCLTELDSVTEDLDAAPLAYFVRLRRLGELLLQTAAQP
ncbi:MAG: hypothetical protein NNA30_03210 [Nitrospira sp.]|nr:hypothetical protein [Nitrospira sp.]